MTSRAASSDASLPSPSSSLASVTGPAWPMHFVYLDEKGKLRTDPESVALLQPVKKAIGVVTLWGCPRLEESMILMQTFGKSSAFQAPSTHKPRTNGLWLRTKALDGTEYDLLLLGSEGVDGNDQMVLGGLCSEYEAASHGQSKWQKLAVFLRESWEGPIEDLGKRLIDQFGCQRSSCMLKCQAIEYQVGLLKKELEASENYKSQYLKQYKDAIRDKTLSDDYSSLQGTCGSFEERSSSLLKTLESTKQESLDWNRKYEQVLSEQKAEEDQTSSEIAILKSQSSAAEARVAAGEEQAQSNLEEAEEWKRKYDIAFREAKAALEKAAIAQERTDKDTPEMEDGLRVEFIEVATKEDELKEKAAQFEYAEQCLTSIKSELKAAESKIEKYDVEIMTLKKEIKALSEKFETTNGKVQIWEMESLRLKEILRDGLQLPIMKDLAARGVWPVSTSVNGA